MTPKIFISYSSENAWVLKGLQKLIHSAAPEASVFCSYSGSILPGENYKEAIFDNLDEANVFVAIVSNEYWKSKYCIIEMGAAYQRYYFDEKQAVDIQPLLLPPLERRYAMANTPLTELQVTDMTSVSELTAFLRRLAGADGDAVIDGMQIPIAEYTSSLRRTILMAASLTEGAAVNVYYDEPEGNPIPKDSVVRCRRMTGDEFSFEFRLSRLDYTPKFASITLEYWDEINFREYLVYNRDARFTFRIDNIDGVLNSVDVEFKFGPNHEVFQRIPLEVSPGKNQLSISLSEMNYKPLGEINQICFVIHPEDMNAKDGEVLIDQITVSFEN